MQKQRILLFLSILIGTLVASCTPEEPKTVDLTTLLPPDKHALDVVRLDTNGDGRKEWIVLYTYDKQEEKSPVDAVIYHADRSDWGSEFPIVYPYPVDPVANSYLGEGNAKASLEDVISVHPGGELVFRSTDKEGRTTMASIFVWEDHNPDPQAPPQANLIYGQGYRCLGDFRADLSIDIALDSVTVKQSIGDRSQLATVRTYKPQDGSYLRPDQTLVDPKSSCITFAYGMPENVERSPYPEKVVMAFYTTYTSNEAERFLTDAARARLRSGEWAFISPQPRTLIRHVCVTRIRYVPEAEVEARATAVAQAQAQWEQQAAAQSGTPIPSPAPFSFNLPLVWIDVDVLFSPQDNPEQPYTLSWGLLWDGQRWKIDQVRWR